MKYWKRNICLSALFAMATSTIGAYDGLSPEYTTPSKEDVPFMAAVKSHGKWGAIDHKGNTLIPLIYDRIGLSLSDASTREEDLSREDTRREQLIEVEENHLRGFYNREGKEIIPVSYESRSIWKEGALAVREKDGKIRFYTDQGTLISKNPSYREVSDFQESMAIVKQGAMYGYLSLDGKEITPKYEEARYFDGGLAPVKEKGKWGVIDTAGHMVIPPIYKETGPSFDSGLLAVKNNKNLWGFINGAGEVIVPLQYKEVSPTFSEGYAAIENENKQWGFVNQEGKVTISPQFKEILSPFSEGLAGVKTVDGNGYVKPDGTMAFMADYDRLYPFENGLAEIREGEVISQTVSRPRPISIGIGWGWGHWFRPHHRYHPWGWGIGFPIWDPWYYEYETIPTVQVKRGYIDHTGKVIASPSNDRVFPATSNGILIFNHNRYGFVNRKGDFIAHTTYLGLLPEEEDTILLVKDESKNWGILSMADGHEILPCTYKEIQSIGGGLYKYKVDNQWGLMDKEGHLIGNPCYEAVASYGEGLIPVKENGSWHFVDEEGKTPFTPLETFSDVTPFVKGFAGVKVKGKWGLIDRSGHYILSPTYEDLDML